MNEAHNSLAPARLFDLVRRTLLMMLGRRPISGSYVVDAPALWQAIWASVIFTFVVSVYPGLQYGISVLVTSLILQLVTVVLTVLLFARILNGAGLGDRLFVFAVPFLWVENVQHLVGGVAWALMQYLAVLSGDMTLLVLIAPLVFWTIYWLWRIGRDQLGRGGWFATGLLCLSFVIDAGLSLFVQSRVQIPPG